MMILAQLTTHTHALRTTCDFARHIFVTETTKILKNNLTEILHNK